MTRWQKLDRLLNNTCTTKKLQFFWSKDNTRQERPWNTYSDAIANIYPNPLVFSREIRFQIDNSSRTGRSGNKEYHHLSSYHILPYEQLACSPPQKSPFWFQPWLPFTIFYLSIFWSSIGGKTCDSSCKDKTFQDHLEHYVIYGSFHRFFYVHE